MSLTVGEVDRSVRRSSMCPATRCEIFQEAFLVFLLAELEQSSFLGGAEFWSKDVKVPSGQESPSILPRALNAVRKNRFRKKLVNSGRYLATCIVSESCVSCNIAMVIIHVRCS